MEMTGSDVDPCLLYQAAVYAALFAEDFKTYLFELVS